MPRPIGQRVVAIRDVDAKGINLFGFGVYEGNKTNALIAGTGLGPNPCIRLDSGEYVWGYECWWMSEKDFLETTPKDTPRVIVGGASNTPPIEDKP